MIYWKHFKTIVKHKWYVFLACCQCGIIWRGIVHDLSKFSFKEFFTSAKYFQGNKNPIDKEKEVKGYSLAWMHHKGRNRHHWQYWIDFKDGCATPLKMPFKDVAEMICDWIGAGKAYNQHEWSETELINFWLNNKDKMILHEETRKLIDHIIHDITHHGWKDTAVKIKDTLVFEPFDYLY